MTRDELEKEIERIHRHVKTLWDANEEIWCAVHLERSQKRSEGLRKMADNGEELEKASKQEKDLCRQLLKLDEPS
jgi:hypothetical protein